MKRVKQPHKEKIDILNDCHKKHIKGMESIHTKEFPVVYTDTALDAMDIFGQQKSLEFFAWVNKNYYKGKNGWIPHGWGAYAFGCTIKQLYERFINGE
jgi:hypothetical protein